MPTAEARDAGQLLVLLDNVRVSRATSSAGITTEISRLVALASVGLTFGV